MAQATLDEWPTTTREAIAMQQTLRGQIIDHDDFDPIRSVAGVDVGFEAHGSIARAAVAVLTFPELLLMEWAVARERTRFPYVPGLLSFRELPVVMAALRQLMAPPDLILCDGQGIAHPRRFGIACHLGLLTNLPTIGVAKSRLVGTHDGVPTQAGARQALRDRGETIGMVLRTRSRVSPLFISAGHRVSLTTAVNLTLACVGATRLPETTRWAHHLASERREGKA